MGFGSGASEYIALQLHAVDDRADSALPGSSYWHFSTGVPSGSSPFGCQDGERARARRKIHGPRAPERDRSVWACADREGNPLPVSACEKYHSATPCSARPARHYGEPIRNLNSVCWYRSRSQEVTYCSGNVHFSGRYVFCGVPCLSDVCRCKRHPHWI